MITGVVHMTSDVMTVPQSVNSSYKFRITGVVHTTKCEYQFIVYIPIWHKPIMTCSVPRDLHIYSSPNIQESLVSKGIQIV